MKMKFSKEELLSLYPVLRGRRVMAEYKDHGLPEYQGNAAIESLPIMLEQTEIAALLADFPSWKESDRKLSRSLRIQCLDRLRRVFISLPDIGSLAEQILTAIFAGYIDRNPASTKFHIERKAKILAFKKIMEEKGVFDEKSKELLDKLIIANDVNLDNQNNNDPIPVSNYNSSGRGFAFIGIPGIGKTTAAKRILLELLPQVIVQTTYKDEPIYQHQIVWLYIQCPHDGSLANLCKLFFLAVDQLLGTPYYQIFASTPRHTADIMALGMAIVASLHNIGCLVIDEMQFLSAAKSGGYEKLLNFLTGLENILGVPLILVGTHKALDYLAKDLRQTRRSTAPSGVVWNMMPPPQKLKSRKQKDEGSINGKWELFIDALWKQQYTKTETPLDYALSNALYNASRGITDLAVKGYILAQKWAMDYGDVNETITPEIIEKATNHGFRILAPILKLMVKGGSRDALKKYEDVYPAFVEYFDNQPFFSSENDNNSGKSKTEEGVSSPDEKPQDQSQVKPTDKLQNTGDEKKENSSGTQHRRNGRRKKADKVQAELAKKVGELTGKGVSLSDALNQLGITLDQNELFS